MNRGYSQLLVDMPEAYPRRNPWPFVLAGLLLFGITLVPPTQWPELVRDAHLAWATVSTEEQNDPLASPGRYQEQNSRVVVGFDPRAFAPALSSGALPPATVELAGMPTPVYPLRKTEVEATEIPEPETNSVSLPHFGRMADLAARPLNARPVDARPVDARPAPVAASHSASQSSLVATNSERVGNVVGSRPASPGSWTAGRQVWIPPSDWQPHLIEPFTNDELQLALERDRKRPQQAERGWATLPVMGPVAKQERNTDLRRKPVPPEFDPNASLSVEVESTVELDVPERPTELVPQTPDIALPKIEAVVAEPPAPVKVTTSSLEDSPWGRAAKLHSLMEVGAKLPLLKDWCTQLRLRSTQIQSSPFNGDATQLSAISTFRTLANYPANTSRWPQATRETYWRIRHAAVRHADLWWAMSSLLPGQQKHLSYETDQLLSATEALAERLNTSDGSTAKWAEYLQLSDLQDTNDDLGVRAEKVLSRMYDSRLQPQQQQFLSQPIFRDLDQRLRAVIAAEVDSEEVLHVLNKYEDDSSDVNARQLIAKLQRFSAANDTHRESALKTIDAYYRNANFRISVSEQFVNRLVPAFHQYAEQVNDTILGAAVRGRNSTMTNFRVNLIPDPQSIRLELFANGKVDSNTSSRKGPVVMYNRGTSQFAAEKELSISAQGIFSHQTETRAVTGNRVVGMRTDLDGIPFLGALIRSIARQQVSEQRPFLRAEILRRVQRTASRKIDVEVQRRLSDVEQRVQSRVVEPLQRMELDPRSMEMRSTADRVIVRTRLAGPLQLGAHTPRPQARCDNQMSFQLHQTAANNWLNQLSLKGRRMTLAQLGDELSNRLRMKIEIPAKRKEAVVEFAKDVPVEFEFQGGHVKFTVHFAELNNGRDQWKNFSVCAHYRADAERLDVELIRDGGIELITEPLGLRDQIALRSIFTKVFDGNPRLEILRRAIEQQPSLQNLAITQLIIRDGWISLALGEQASAAHVVPAVARSGSRETEGSTATSSPTAAAVQR